jgi:hypothetical protein
MKKLFIKIFIFYLYLNYINCQKISNDNEFSQEKPINKFLYQLQKPEEIKDEIKNNNISTNLLR